MKKLLLSVVALVAITTAGAQNLDAPRVALKSNLLSLSLGNIDLGAEIRLSEHWSLATDLNFSALHIWGKAPYAGQATAVVTTVDNLDGFYTNGWSGFVEGRYYFKQALYGHHLGVYAMGGRYGKFVSDGGWQSLITNGGFEDYGTNAYVTSVGISYGYAFKFSDAERYYWGLDLYIGGGLIYAEYDPALTDELGTGRKYEASWSLVKTGVALSYTF